VHEHHFCQSCQVDFDSYADQNIVLSISIHPDLFTDALPDQPLPREKDNRVQPVSALELIGIPAFNEHFASQIPPLDHSVKIRSATLMFTDLIQSTQLYSQIGDIKAYTFVKQHFDILFTEILNHSGGIIKTIGDAVMAVFSDSVEAVSVAFQIKEAVNHLLQANYMDEQYGLRVSISSGPALVVNMNDQIDLFGTMVNRGARLVGFASKETIAVSEEIMSQTKVQQFLSEQHILAKSLKEPLKGFPGLNTLFLLRQAESS
jgi:class 3 adenylate cyclase